MEKFIDYYKVLGVEADAPASAIKAAFKKLALQYHPDVYKGEDAQERMRLLLEAYQTLNDPAERKMYDMRRVEHIPGTRIYRNQSVSKKAQRATEVSPGARRDRNRHYDFPDLAEEEPAVVNLVDIKYNLSAEEATRLKRDGMLRGLSAEARMTYPATYTNHSHYCHRCHHRWTPTAVRTHARNGERFCPSCKARDWGDYLLLRCCHCRAVFESEQIRYEVGSYNYGGGTLCPPYELFPLCPYCGKAEWCPAENMRVQELRIQAAQRAARLRLLWVSMLIVAVLFIGVMMFMLAR